MLNLQNQDLVLLKVKGARLERALINYMLDFNRERGFEEWYVPFIWNSNTLQGTGQLPKFADDLFKIEVKIYT